MMNLYSAPFRTQWKILLALYILNKECYYTELYHLLRANPTLIRKQLELLEKAKLIKSIQTNQRGKKPQAYYSLTPKGKRIGKHLAEIEQILKR